MFHISLTNSLFQISLTASIYTTLALAIERFVCVCRPYTKASLEVSNSTVLYNCSCVQIMMDLELTAYGGSLYFYDVRTNILTYI
jgi:hypothetical protein